MYKVVKYWLILFLFCMTFMQGLSQSLDSNINSNEKLANQHYENGSYSKALELYKYAIEKERASPLAALRLARVYYYLNDKVNAIKYFEQYHYSGALQKEDILMYANALTATGNYTQAIEEYNDYLHKFGDNEWVTMKIWRLNNLDFLFEDSVSYKIHKIGGNTGYSEFPLTFYRDGLLALSDRGSSKKLMNIVVSNTSRNPYSLFHFQNLSISNHSDNFSVNLSALIKTGPYHVAGLSFMADESAFIYAKNHGKSKSNSGQEIKLFVKRKYDSGDGDLLNINKSGVSLKHPSLSSSGQQLYFAADFKGGFGGTDIYRCDWEDNQWSKPVNLGSMVNTPGNEAFPDIQFDNNLYFSSEGLPGFGGYDIYKYEVSNKNAESINLGYPVNSSKDDFAFILSDSGEFGYFASNRINGGLDDDIYSVEIDLQKYPLSISGLLKYKNLDSRPSILKNTFLEVIDNNTLEVVHETNSDSLGRFNIQIPYSSQYFIRVKMQGSESLVVSLEVPKNKDQQTDHELIVVRNGLTSTQTIDN